MMKLLNIFIAIVFLVSPLYSQPNYDSLINSVNGLDELNQVKKLTELCWEYRSKAPEKSIKLGLAALKKIELINASEYKAETYNYLGVIYGNLGSLDSAFYYYKLAIETATGMDDSVQIAYSLNNIGDYYFKNALYSIALENIFHANDIFEKMKDERGVAYTLNDIGEIYLKQSNTEKALEYFLKSGEIRFRLNDDRGYAKSLINQAAVYLINNLTDEALETYYEALKYSERTNYLKGISWVYGGIAQIYFKLGKYNLALENTTKSLEIDLEIGNKYGELINYNQLGLINIQTGNLSSAEKYLKLAEKEADSTGHLDQLIVSYEHLKNLSVKKNDFRNAYKYLENYNSLNDSIFSQDNANRIADLQTAFLTERKDRENELLKKDIQIEKVTRNYLLLIFILIIAAGFVVIWKYKSEKKTNAMLNELNIQKDKMFSIIGHDLKNPVGAINNFLELMFFEYDDFTDKERKEFIELSYGASQTLIILLLELLEWGRLSRNIITVEKQPIEIDKIVEEIFDLVSSQAKQKNIKLEMVNCNTTIYSDRNMINTVLRNFVNNAIKFTPRGGSITLSTHEDEQFSYISTKDTGIGIDPGSIDDLFRIDLSTSTKGTEDEPGTGLGLPICKEFVEKCGGTINVISDKGKGSEFIVIIPKNN